ncbi:MAG: hypothetical protein ACPGLV_03690, partial [Bacteroidia bacterium]
IGFLFFSAIDSFSKTINKTNDDDWLSITENFKGFEFEFTESNLPPTFKFTAPANTTWFSLKTQLHFNALNGCYLLDYHFNKHAAFLLGVNESNTNIRLYVITTQTIEIIELNDGEWSFEHNEDQDSDGVELHQSNKKSTTIYTFSPTYS